MRRENAVVSSARHGAPAWWPSWLTADRIGALSCAALLLGLLLLHSVLAPPYRGPDEAQHLDLARQWSYHAEYETIGRHLSAQVGESLRLVRFNHETNRFESERAVGRGERPRLNQLGPDEASDSYNQISQHGPLYPMLVGSALTTIDLVEPGPRWAFDRELAVARLLTILLLVPVPILIFFAARELGMSRIASWVAGVVPSSIPQFTHIGALVNNDALVVLLAAVCAWLLARSLRRGLSTPTLVGLGAAVGLGLLTKAFIVGPAAAVGVAILWLWRRERGTIIDLARHAAVFAGVAVLAGGWWPIRNVAVFGTPQPTGPPLLPPPPPGFQPDVGEWFGEFAHRMPRTFYGWFGWLEVPLGRGWIAVGLATLAVGLALGVGRVVLARRRGDEPDGLSLVEVGVFALPFLVLGVVSARNAYQEYVNSSLFPALQGRYLFAALPFLAVIIGLGYGVRRLQARVATVLAAMSWVLVVQWAAAATMLDYFWGPEDGSLRDQVAAMLVWAPWPRPTVVLFALVALGGVALAGTVALRFAIEREPGRDGNPVAPVAESTV